MHVSLLPPHGVLYLMTPSVNALFVLTIFGVPTFFCQRQRFRGDQQRAYELIYVLQFR